MAQVRNIFDHIKSLEYKDRPNYELIRNNLKSIMADGENIPYGLTYDFHPVSLMPIVINSPPAICAQKP